MFLETISNYSTSKSKCNVYRLESAEFQLITRRKYRSQLTVTGEHELKNI